MFNDPIAVETFKRLVNEFKVVTFIETGTNTGNGAYQASKFVPVVHTIENDEALHRNAQVFWRMQLKTQPIYGIILDWLGNSPDVLRDILKSNPAPTVCFYLDAHGGEYWPLLDELKVIAESGIKDCVITIHDFKVPGKPWGYDSYGGKDLDIDYVREALAAINPNFKIFYNEEADGNKRGIMYATP